MVSIDQRTRRYADVRPLTADEVFDDVLPTALATNGQLAARGATVMELPSLGLDVDGRGGTLAVQGDRLELRSGTDGGGAVVAITEEGLSNLVQDIQSTMGLAMTSKVSITAGSLDDWIAWEPTLRALLDGRPVHETGAVEILDPDGAPLDLARSFTLDDDRPEIAHFLSQAGFLHVRGVFDEAEMDAVRRDIDDSLAAAAPDDGESWWATDADGVDRAVRVLFFDEKSDALARLLRDDRMQWLRGLTGDHYNETMGAEGLVKPLNIVKGLSDLPWHKDCGQGLHSYRCSGLTIGISVTGADRASGALGVIPGSHRANTTATMRDKRLDLQPVLLETQTGDITVHCSDTLHRAHPPVDRPRHVVYTDLRLAPADGDRVPSPPRDTARAARARLSNVTERIEAADNQTNQRRFRAVRS